MPSKRQGYELLRVDLGSRTAVREPVPAGLIDRFIGGKGLAAHNLATELPAGADALGPENPLMFMTGPVSGIFPGTTRHVVATKSPATGGFCDSFAGGFWAWEMRKAGLLGIMVTGAADRPVYLRIDDGEAVIEDAGGLWGRSIIEVDDAPRFAAYRVAAIGPAGENRVVFAGIGNNAGLTKNGRSGYNGRAGAGAVMGAKKLKAIAIRGTARPELDEAGRELRLRLLAQIKQPDAASSWLAEAGTPIIVDWTNGVSVLPTRNWRSGSFDQADEIGHEAVKADRLGVEGCYNCPVNCGQHVRARSGAFTGAEARKIEYETIGLAASNTGNGDFSGIVRFSEQCDALGLDTISAGAAIAFAMDCAAEGVIDSPLRFGDSEGQAELVEQIASREGLGADLADGVRATAMRWGVDPTKINVFEVKGLEFPAYDPRGSVGMALAYATADRGACHMPSWPIAAEALSEEEGADPFGPAGKAEFVIGEQDENSAEWSLVGCDFLGYGAEDAVSMLQAVGIPLGAPEYLEAGARVWNLVRLINMREGWTALDDRMPEGLANPLEDSGRSLDGQVFDEMKRDYYRLRRWDAQGRPTPELIAELGLKEYADLLGWPPGSGADA